MHRHSPGRDCLSGWGASSCGGRLPPLPPCITAAPACAKPIMPQLLLGLPGPTMHLALVLAVLFFFGTSTPNQATLQRIPRASFSRPSTTHKDPQQETLIGYDCLGRPEATQVVSYPNPESCGRLPPTMTIERRTFDVYQLRQSTDIAINTCRLTISRFVGRCSMKGGNHINCLSFVTTSSFTIYLTSTQQ